MIKEEIKEALSELINIAFGSATAIIADLFDNFATLNIPNIKVIPVDQIEIFFKEDKDYQNTHITTQQFKGTFEGELVFVMDNTSALNMQKLICEAEDFDSKDYLNEHELKQSIMEISNILGSSCIGKLVELLEADAIFSPPTIESIHQFLSGLSETQYSQIVIISTVLDFHDAQISGKLLIMFNKEMFSLLENSLEEFLAKL
jgi:chemotaxis protein CheC